MTLWQAPLSQPEPVRVILADTSATTIIPAAAYKQAIGKIRVVNKTSGAVTVNLEVYDGTTAFSLTGVKSIAANDAVEIYDEILQSGDLLRATAGTGSSSLVVHAIFALSAQR